MLGSTTIFEAASRNDLTGLQHFLQHGISKDAQFVASSMECVHQVFGNIAFYGSRTVAGGLGTLFGLTGIVMSETLVGAALGVPLTGISIAGGKKMWDTGDWYFGESTFHRQGWTPLHFAAASGAINTAVFLILHGARLDIKDSQGRTCLGIATIMKCADFTAVCNIVSQFRHQHLVALQKLEERINTVYAELLGIEQIINEVESELRITRETPRETVSEDGISSSLWSFVAFFRGRPEDPLAQRIASLENRLRGLRSRIAPLAENTRRFTQEAHSRTEELRRILAENIRLREYSETLHESLQSFERNARNVQNYAERLDSPRRGMLGLVRAG